jgi:hypothetical protein
MRREYDDYGRVEWIRNWNNSGYTHFVYETNDNYIHTYQTVVDVAHEFHCGNSDGAGRARCRAVIPAAAAASLAHVVRQHGPVSQQSNPTEMNGSWALPAMTRLARQPAILRLKGRVTQVTNTDGTTKVVLVTAAVLRWW